MQGDYLWAGTDGGVVRWDTRDGSYTKFTTADGLAGNRIASMTSDPAGNMWFGSSSGGVSKYDGKIMTTYCIFICPAITPAAPPAAFST